MAGGNAPAQSPEKGQCRQPCWVWPGSLAETRLCAGALPGRRFLRGVLCQGCQGLPAHLGGLDKVAEEGDEFVFLKHILCLIPHRAQHSVSHSRCSCNELGACVLVSPLGPTFMPKFTEHALCESPGLGAGDRVVAHGPRASVTIILTCAEAQPNSRGWWSPQSIHRELGACCTNPTLWCLCGVISWE